MSSLAAQLGPLNQIATWVAEETPRMDHRCGCLLTVGCKFVHIYPGKRVVDPAAFPCILQPGMSPPCRFLSSRMRAFPEDGSIRDAWREFISHSSASLSAEPTHGSNREPGAVRVLPYQNIYGHNNTVDDCLNQCAYYGFPAGGMEVSFSFRGCFTSRILIRHCSTARNVVSFFSRCRHSP